MKTARRIILVLVAMLCMQMSAAYASINYMADADLASKDLNNVMTMYIGMPEKDFLNNFSAVQDWKVSDKQVVYHDTPTYFYRLTKGNEMDIVSEQVIVEVYNDSVCYIDWRFNTNTSSAKRIIYGRIQNNMMKQPGIFYVDEFGGSRWQLNNVQAVLYEAPSWINLSVGRSLFD